MLGLGLGLQKSNNLPSPLQNLIKSSSFLITGDKATLTSPGVNSPFTNPWKDLKKQADVTLQGFAGTTSDGWVDVLCPNGKTKKFLKFDGLDSLGIANHPNLDIVGTGDFAIGLVFKTSGTIGASIIVYKGLDGYSNQQYAIRISDVGITFERSNEQIFLTNSVEVNTLYKLLVYRKSGRLKAILLNSETYNQANVWSLVTQPYFRIGARSINTGGTSHNLFANVALGTLDIINGAITPFTEADLIKKWDAFCKSEYGL